VFVVRSRQLMGRPLGLKQLGKVMSNTQIAFLNRNQVPSRDALQTSINRLAFDLKLHPDFTPFEDVGFSPCVLNGTPDVGFEVFYAPAAEIVGDDANLLEITAGRDFSMSMVWHSSMMDCAAVMIVSCALARDFDAVVSYEGEQPEALDALIGSARSILAEADKEIRVSPAQQTMAPVPLAKRPWWKFW
jgi:hypothetical protein